MNREIWIGIIAAVLIMGGFFGYQYLQKAAPVVETASAPAAAVPAEPAIKYPVPEPKAAEPPLPALSESDEAVHGDLRTLFAAAPIESLLIPKHIVQNFVATVNGLDGAMVPLRLWPLAHLPQLPLVTQNAEGMSFSADNAQRYAPYIAALKALDARQAAALYLRYYPLFQQAYVELGYPDRYFNDRLVSVIDHLLATPEIKAPIRLLRPKVLYEYQDPALEQRSSGQKLLIRMGPANEAIVKAKLTEIRNAIVGQSPSAP